MKYKLPNILITGGSGFIGSNFVNSIHNKVNKIIIIDKKPPLIDKSINNLKYFQTEYDRLTSIKKHIKDVDVVLHLASTSFPFSTNFNPQKDLDCEIVKNINFFNFLSKNKIKKIIFPSSGGTIYGEINGKANKIKDMALPISFYGAHKLLIENYLNIYFKLEKLEPLILRISNPYGANQSNYMKQGFIGTAIKSVLANKKIDIWGDGSNIRDYIYIDDLTCLLEKAVLNFSQGTFNVGSGKGYSVNEVIEQIKKIHKGKIKIKFSNHNDYDVKKSILDISLTNKKFNWKPKTSLKQGIQLVYKNIKNEK